MVRVPREHPSSTSNPRDPSSELMGQPSCTSTPQRALNSWTSSRARQLTKDLGACSPRETHTKEPTSTHELSSYVLLVGTPICQNAGKQDQNKPQATSRRKTPHQGTNTLSKAKMPRQAKSKHLVKFSLAGFCPSSLFSPMPHGLLAH